MSNAADQVQSLAGRSTQPTRLMRGEDVELRLDTGEVVDGTITALRSRSTPGGKIAARSKAWSRWSGTPDHLVALAEKAIAEISGRSGDVPSVTVRIVFDNDDEERYFDIASFGNDIRSTASGTPGSRSRAATVRS